MSYKTSGVNSFSSKATKVERRMSIQKRMANEQLRYTDLNMDNVSKRVGFGSANNHYLTYKREFGIATVSVARRFARKGMCGGKICKYNNLNIV
jgi:transcriptional regulator GlxA family with amidase domain